MFTGIIEALGSVKEVISNGSNRTFWITSPLSGEFRPDQSVSHNGVCLTVEEVRDDSHRVTAIDETLQKSELGNWKNGSLVNIERCLPVNGRLDGHFVQGHVDTTGKCIKVAEKNGSWELKISFPKKYAALIIEKGSIAINGISLTIFNAGRKNFTVAIIPYTYEHTNIRTIKEGDKVNLEFDILGKYLLRRLSLKEK
jgi:riboflavin synthase